MMKTIKMSESWLHNLVTAASLGVILLVVGIWVQGGTLLSALRTSESLTWYLIRSSGMVSYGLLLISTVWGLFLSSRLVKAWSPGPVSMTLHATVSWLALLLGGVHAVLLLADAYFTFTVLDVLVPFRGPYRPIFTGLGTAAFWLLLVISVSFPLKRHIGQGTWKRLHYASYLAFGMVSAHGLFAGTDGERLGFRILAGLGLALVLLLLGLRLGRDSAPPRVKSSRRAA